MNEMLSLSFNDSLLFREKTLADYLLTAAHPCSDCDCGSQCICEDCDCDDDD